MLLPLHLSCIISRRDFNECRRRAHSELTRSSARKLKRKASEVDEARLDHIVSKANVSLQDMHKLQSKEITPSKLESYSKFVDSIVMEAQSKCERSFQTFRKTLLSEEDTNSILERTRQDFPISYNFQLGMILPQRSRGDEEKQKKKEFSALWAFISAIRKRNPRLCIALAAMVSLSLTGGSISDKTIKFVSHLGISASKDVLVRTIKGIGVRSAATWEWQCHFKFILQFFDNFQYALPYKVQVDGRSTNMVEGTSRFAREVDPFDPPEQVPFATDEGQPELTYTDQVVPAPIGLPPLERLSDQQFEKLLEDGEGIRHALRDDVFRRTILGENIESFPFDIDKMEPTDGTRTESYLKHLRQCARYAAFWQFLSSEKTIGRSNPFVMPMPKRGHDVIEIVKSSRAVVLKNARDFHEETVRTWFPSFEDETRIFVYSVSTFREKTTEECAKVIVQLLLDCGLLVVCADDKIRVRPDYEDYRVIMCGDQYSVEKGNQFAAKAAASLGTFHDDYETNMNIAKAMSRLMWTPGHLHVEFRMCYGVYIMFYGGFLHAFQAAGQVTRLVQDSSKCFQLATTFLRMVYEQVYRGFAFHWLLNVIDGETEIPTIHAAVQGFDEFLRSMWESSDEVYRYLACFLELSEVYFLFLECVECADQLGCELLLIYYQPIFYVCNMTNYKELVWRQMDSLYGSETSILERETCRRNVMIRLNKGKNCMGTDTVGEIINFLLVQQRKSKDIKHVAAKSSAITMTSQADEWRRQFICGEVEGKSQKSSTKKRSAAVRGRLSELAVNAELYREQPGRKITELDMYSLLNDLVTPFPPKKSDEDDEHDDELTAAERADKERNKTIASIVNSVIPKKERKKDGDDDDGVSSDEDSDSEDDDIVMADDVQSQKKKTTRKILTDNKKLRIGSSTQDKMSIDPKGVAKVNPFEKGKEAMAKDNVKEKRARAKVEQNRKCKLAELCYLRTLRVKAVASVDSRIDPFPSCEHDEAQVEYDSRYSPWR